MSETDFQKEMEQELLKMRASLLASLEDNDAESRNIASSATINDTIDDASEEITLKKLEAVNRIASTRLKAIDAALTRIREGKYGYCLRCGKKIPEERLRALPFAVLCMDCKHQQEGFHR